MVVKLATIATNPADRLAVYLGNIEDTPNGYEFHPGMVSFSTFKGLSTSQYVPYSVSLDRLGRVRRIYAMPESVASRALLEFGTGVDGDGSAWILKRLGAGVRIAAIVEYKKPVSEEGFRPRFMYDNSARILLSRARRDGYPIYWDGGQGCQGSTTPAICSGSPVTQFRDWVSKLGPQDDGTLRGFGLSVGELRKAASDGLIHGIIADGGSAQVMRALQRDSNVSGIWIIDIRPCLPTDDCP
ncbi:hypothetical protein [Sphaerisporangium rhizosphaerae]|uniref:Uncharacterized protein n=1 Tax=Sphaerisporangium rhizosphaerae TaxID=2269375 RepID=A0ABW2PHU0_9ACTN